MEEKILELVKEYKTIKAVYMTMQEDNLYQKWEITE